MQISGRQFFLNHLAQTSDAPLMLEVASAEGCWLYDNQGKKYLDLISGISVSSLGHGHPEIKKAITEQLNRHLHVMVYGEIIQQPQLDLADALSGVLPGKFDNFYFVNSGSEAIDGAMKLAKRFTGKHHFAAQTLSYHGSSQGPLSLMSDPYFSDAYKPLLPDIHFFEQNNIESLHKIPADHLAAVVIELVQGEKGAVPGRTEFIEQVAEFCRKNGVLLIVDEIQTGIGRTGTMFAFEQYNIVPDILVLGKALGGGLPIGAFIAPKTIMHSLSENPVLGHITTFGGHPLSCAAAAQAVRLTSEGLTGFNIAAKEALIREWLVHPEIKEITGMGLLLAVHLRSEEKCKKLIQYGLNHEVFTDWFLFASNAFRIAPPLNISYAELEFACKVLLQGLNEV